MGAFWSVPYGRIRSEEVVNCCRCERNGVEAKERQWNYSLVDSTELDEYDTKDNIHPGYCFHCYQALADEPTACSICGDLATDLFEGWAFCAEHRPNFGDKFYGPVG